MAYDDIIKKYKPQIQSPQASPTPTFERPIPTLEKNPYKKIVENHLAGKRQAAYNAGTKATEESVQKTLNPGVFKNVIDTVKATPKAGFSIMSSMITDPIKTLRAGIGGALDLGPSLANTAQWIGRSILSKVYGKEEVDKYEEIRLPKPSETLAEYMGYERTEEEKAITEGTKMYLGYAAGQGILKASGANKFMTNVAGDVLGGQLTSDSRDLKERATQAAFDGFFGTAQVVGGKLIRGAKAETKIPAKAEVVDVADGSAKAPETPVAEAPVKAETPSMVDETTPATTQKATPAPEKPKGVTEMKQLTEDGPKTAYVAKDDLGLDARGKKIMATTEVDTKTGDAVVYYIKKLDDNPELRDLVWDFEEPHILDKRLSMTGDSFTPALSNPSGNMSVLEKALGTFSKKMGQSIDEISEKLQKEIESLSSSRKVVTEQFADAYGIYKNNPAKVKKQAPTFAKFMEHQLVEPRFSKNVTTEAKFEREFPEAKKMKAKPADNIVSVEGKTFELSGKAKERYLEAKTRSDTYIDTVKKRVGGERAQAIIKGEGMQMAALKRELTGQYTSTELRNLIKRERSNYIGKDVKVRINGKDVDGTIVSTSSFGNVKVAVGDDQVVMSIKNSDILDDVRTDEQIAKKVTKRTESKLYEPKTEKTKIVEKKVEKPGKFSSTGLKTGKEVTGKSSFNPKTIDVPEDVEILFNKLDAENKNFSGQRISKGNEDLKDLGRMTGLTEDELLDLAPGSIANSETLVAARQIVLNKMADLSNKLKGFDIEKASLVQKAEIRDAFLKVTAMQKSVAGLRTEASNVLRSFGVKLRPGENIAIDELITNLKKMGIDDIDTNDLTSLSEAAGKMSESLEMGIGHKIGKGALQVWYASILSGPKTSIRNILSTSANIMSDIVSKTMNPKQWKEIPASIQGLVKGFNDSKVEGNLRDIFTLKATDPSSGKFYDISLPEAEKVFTGPFEKFGRATEVVGRILNAQDRRLSGAAEGMEKAALEVYTDKMTESVRKAVAESYGVSSVYRGTPKGRLFGALTASANKFLKQYPEGRIIMPFVQTVGNVLDRQFDYIPLFSALRLGKFKIPKKGGGFIEIGSDVLERQADLMMKDYGLEGPMQRELIINRLRDQQIGRMVTGLALTAGAVVMAKEGNLSGAGPTNYSERIALQRTGWRPNSVKIGDMWVPYSYLGPMAGILALAGNIHDKVEYDNKPGKDVSELIGHGISGWIQSQLDNSFLSGASDFLEAVGPSGNPKKYLTQLGANLTPIPQAITQTIDIAKGVAGEISDDDSLRQQYETRDYVSKIRKNLGLTGPIPGIADGLNPRLDQFGQPMTSDIIWGITPSKDKSDAMALDSYLINKEIVVSLPVFGREYSTPDGKKKSLSEEQFSDYVKTSGKEIYRTLNTMLPALETMPDDMAKKQVSKTVEAIRKRVRMEMLYQ